MAHVRDHVQFGAGDRHGRFARIAQRDRPVLRTMQDDGRNGHLGQCSAKIRHADRRSEMPRDRAGVNTPVPGASGLCGDTRFVEILGQGIGFGSADLARDIVIGIGQRLTLDPIDGCGRNIGRDAAAVGHDQRQAQHAIGRGNGRHLGDRATQ